MKKEEYTAHGPEYGSGHSSENGKDRGCVILSGRSKDEETL